eukprot:TRINITY_DN3313_c0_g1_i1.p1 TRINITY_DN3313_c0_g1~~TRINITY_DN3313_c0_g1_i1.p1  ORF type:complete len:368 (+),score=89.11 TRINITY_DN3313_c0_g1_i1:80-1105(+)
MAVDPDFLLAKKLQAQETNKSSTKKPLKGALRRSRGKKFAEAMDEVFDDKVYAQTGGWYRSKNHRIVVRLVLTPPPHIMSNLRKKVAMIWGPVQGKRANPDRNIQCLTDHDIFLHITLPGENFLENARPPRVDVRFSRKTAKPNWNAIKIDETTAKTSALRYYLSAKLEGFLQHQWQARLDSIQESNLEQTKLCHLQTLQAMGFKTTHAKKALDETKGNIEKAVAALMTKNYAKPKPTEKEGLMMALGFSLAQAQFALETHAGDANKALQFLEEQKRLQGSLKTPSAESTPKKKEDAELFAEMKVDIWQGENFFFQFAERELPAAAPRKHALYVVFDAAQH